MHSKDPGSRAGFTLLEVAITLAIFTVVMLSVVSVVSTSLRACQVGAASGNLDALASRTVDAIVDRLQGSGQATVTPALVAPFSSPQIDFQRSTGFVGGVITWGPTERIGFQLRPGELDDGKDNDGDGLVDDGRVVWTRDFGLAGQASVTWADGVAGLQDGELQNGKDDNGNGLIDERGLCFTVDASSVVVRLTLQARGSDGLLLCSSAQRRVFFRNP